MMRPPLLINGFRLGPWPAVIARLVPGVIDESQICEMPVSMPVIESLVDSNAIVVPPRLSDGLVLVPWPRLTWTRLPSVFWKYI